ncbi:FlgL family flagellar hook-associated protein [Wigglesworthia glossinidia endosymbiont of Glossina morsitans morsitans (Yale colony)]|uniref:FlgL family flagellar hook-associated protein n=1 Tax=Wigglesworthia glossinidia endosymbiont of Glossina morsitans morsitans (Yale colony) TaxID=1142511 RepID=H6Q5K8_WIGGL|nr:flagellar hook-associated protein FlgL [Wigglesworthia glossinidia]AFA40912.1 FlgL family flagellar hook-associated protein [Wigglesworthia glossinidia endosymbiont of Glossina morsitans morsitans (Yale colony)]
MTLSTYSLYKNCSNNITYSTSQFHRLTSYFNSGKRVCNASDNPSAISKNIINQNRLYKLNRFNQTRNYIKSFLSKECSILQDISNTLSVIGVKVVSIQKTLGDPTILIEELKSLKNELIMLANSTDENQNYIFSGDQCNQAPFNSNNQENYQGGEKCLQLKISENWQIDIGHIGSEIFIKNEKENLFQKLDALINELSQYALKKIKNEKSQEINIELPYDLINQTKILIQKTENQVFSAQVKSGNYLTKLDDLEKSATSDIEKINEYTQNILGQTHNELIRMASELQFSKVIVESSMQVFQIMKNMSLFNGVI